MFIRSYVLYHKFYLRYLLYFFIILDLFLALFEKPAVPDAEMPYWVRKTDCFWDIVCVVIGGTTVIKTIRLFITIIFDLKSCLYFLGSFVQ